MSEAPAQRYLDGNTADASEVVEKMDLSGFAMNVPRMVVLRNIRANIRRQLPQLAYFNENPQRVAIVGGGWSLRDTMPELLALHFERVPLVAVNGSARWLLERNIRPAMHVVLDARPENLEFVRDPIPGCQYFLASQCDGSLFDACEGRDVTVFHPYGEGSSLEEANLDLFYNARKIAKKNAKDRRWARVPPCTTVGLTTVMVLRILGFRHQHLFGMDSCIDPASPALPIHHAYPQALNDADGYQSFGICGKRFVCSMWQAAQIEAFKKMMLLNGEGLNLTIHGDGVLAHICKVGPDIADAEMKGQANGSASV